MLESSGAKLMSNHFLASMVFICASRHLPSVKYQRVICELKNLYNITKHLGLRQMQFCVCFIFVVQT